MHDHPSAEKLQLSHAQMRALGYQVVDMIIDHYEHISELSLAQKADRTTLEQRLHEPLPEQGSDIAQVLQQVQRDIFAQSMPLDHPRFFAFIPSPSNFVSVMADALTSGFNPFVGSWKVGPGPAEVELVVIDWLRQLCALPEGAGGLCVSGGSVATLTALTTARHMKLHSDIRKAVIYCSDQTHSAVDRALKLLGFSAEQLHKFRADRHFRLPLAELQEAIARDRAAGKLPFCVIANAGTTNTGAIDPLVEIAEICQAEDLWLHIDAAHGGAAVLSEAGSALLPGLDQADSLVLDPHKWLFQPFEIGCVITRQSRWLRETFSVLPEFLRDVAGVEEEVNFRDYGIQLTRSARALKLWMSLKVFGLSAFRQAVTRGIKLAEYTQEHLQQAGCWEIITPAQLGIITFRYIHDSQFSGDLNLLNQQIVEAMLKDGFAFLTSTVLRGQTVLRLCTINPRTTEMDIRETLQRLERFGRAVSS
ncbi:aminotransferase class I/II-fold pyridoxal phosphate-dependent enzyme [Ktedonosporobacter rubrisoli]|uniref:Aminotransferase class I/II-fold pyridoxal phosphate-dependent enzyme n=1 Tax=Ktedonosporobacter rubrisoli TaxID=2509675 RepID=A0A4P6JR91_KTERU|nr:aminotransferase class I/II-fold pyridoxal phosphate-dependent enzyme [Ktedonosporobacter rubrisoli]QBD77844.1 aminotransferase class I/II-fold pyridoxal phosphate-dependent enzyme [Ktedonosporobacter rubrisoli]